MVIISGVPIFRIFTVCMNIGLETKLGLFIVPLNKIDVEVFLLLAGTLTSLL